MPRKLSAGLLLHRSAIQGDQGQDANDEGQGDEGQGDEGQGDEGQDDEGQDEGDDGRGEGEGKDEGDESENQDEDADGGLGLEVLLAHPGGPFWARKDEGAWSIPKGEYEAGQDPFAAAKREFEEELGSAPPVVEYRELGSVSQPGGKLVTAWAAEADFDAAGAVSNTFELQWPPGSGQLTSFPEIDRVRWFTVEVARVKLLKGQRPFLDRLQQMLGEPGSSESPW